MNKLETIKLILTLISGICWTVVYIEGIRLGIKDRSYAIPFYALALNFAWELLHTIFGLQTGVSVQVVINACWFMFDAGILFTYFKYGRKYFPHNLPAGAFISGSILGLVTAFCVEFAFIKEFGVAIGAGYSAFLQNLLMSVLFIDMFSQTGRPRGTKPQYRHQQVAGHTGANHTVRNHRRRRFPKWQLLDLGVGNTLLSI